MKEASLQIVVDGLSLNDLPPLEFCLMIFLSRPLLFSAAVSLEFILSIDSFFGFCVLLRTSVVLIMYMTLVEYLNCFIFFISREVYC